MSNNFFRLLAKEITLELRRGHVLAGLFLYLACSIFIFYVAFYLKFNGIAPPVWASLFWTVILFTSTNSAAKSFIGEKQGSLIYFYSITSPESIILSKIAYNFLLGAVLSITAIILFTIFLSNPVEDTLLFVLCMFLGAGAFASSLTLIAGIAAKASNSNILIAVLGFPIAISTILPVIKITMHAVDGLDRSVSLPDVAMLVAINCLLTAVSYLLFPYIWRT